MKSLLFSLLVCTCVPALAMSAPDTDPLITRSSIDGYSLQLGLANLEGVRTEVTLTGLDNGDIFYRQLVKKHNGFRSGLDLSDLTAGRYLITVTKGETVRRQVILKTEAGVMCSQWK